jgi:hypothetical protein
MKNLNIITDPLDKDLVQGRRYAAVGMNLVPPQDNTIITLHLSDEESHDQSIASLGQLHGSQLL